MTPEQAMGALFTKIKSILDINNMKGSEFVVSVPSYFTGKER